MTNKIRRDVLNSFFMTNSVFGDAFRNALLERVVFSRKELYEYWFDFCKVRGYEIICDEFEEFIGAIRTYCSDFIIEYAVGQECGYPNGTRVIEFEIDPADIEGWRSAMKSIYDPDIHGRGLQEE